MVDVLAAGLNGLNVLLCLGTVVYMVRWLRIFRGGMMEKGLQKLLASVVFFLIAAIARGALVWGVFVVQLTFVDIAIRTVAFVFLFIAIMTIVRQWADLDKSTTPRMQS